MSYGRPGGATPEDARIELARSSVRPHWCRCLRRSARDRSMTNKRQCPRPSIVRWRLSGSPECGKNRRALLIRKTRSRLIFVPGVLASRKVKGSFYLFAKLWRQPLRDLFAPRLILRFLFAIESLSQAPLLDKPLHPRHGILVKREA